MRTIQKGLFLAISLSVAFGALAGCGKKGAGGDGGVDGGVGMNAAGDDPAVVAIFKAAIACKVDESGYFDSDCPAMKEFEESKLLDGKADPTLLNLMKDPDDKVRRLAFKKLAWRGDEKTFKDKVAAGRILDAAEAEKTEANLELAGEVVGHIDVKETATFDRVKKLFAGAGIKMKKQLDRTLMAMGYNTKNDEVWAWHKGLLADADAQVRQNAMGAYWGTPGNLRRAEVCVIYKENFGHADPLVSAKAAAYSSGGSECIADLEAAINEVSKRGKANGIPSEATDYNSVLGDPWKNSKITPAHKKHKLAVSKELALNTKLPDNIRRGAVESAYGNDPVAGKALAASLVKDKAIGSYAKSVVDKK